MTTPTQPFYVKLSHNLISIVLIGFLIYIGSDILMPLFFSIVLAILLMPVADWLTRKGLPKVMAMLLSIILALLFIAAVIYFLSTQVAAFMGDLPEIKKQLYQHWHTVQQWVSKTFHYTYKEQDKAIAEATQEMKGSGSGMVGTTLLSAISMLIYVVLLPLYTFLIMYYRQLISKFLTDSFGTTHKETVREVIEESKTIVQGYMVGLLIEMAIVTILNAIAFFIIGISYAIFLAVFVAILNMIPYVGMLVATVFCMLVTLTTSNNLNDVLWVGAALTIVQLIDNNLLMPYVVSSKVRINALVSIIGVLIGGALAGVSGMFLSIPGVAILKAIFERVEGLKPWGMLMGDDQQAGKKKIGQRKTAGTKK